MKRILGLIMLTGALALLIACGSTGTAHAPTYGSPQEDPLSAAESAYSYAVADFTAAQADLLEIIPDAEATLENVTESDVANPGLLNELRNILQNADTAMGESVPAMESDAEKIQIQAEAIREKTNTIRNLIYEIDDAILAIQNSQQELIEIQRMERVSAEVAYVGTAQTINGYKAEYTISLTHWIRASDTESLQLAWEGVGGTDSVPSISQFHKYTNDGFTEASAVIAFGNMSFKNITEGFDITADNPVSFVVNVSIENKFHPTLQPQLYVKYASSSNTFRWAGYGGVYPNISPLMTSNAWGPVPFMIVLPNAFTPNDPNGVPQLDNFRISFSATSAFIEWECVSITTSW